MGAMEGIDAATELGQIVWRSRKAASLTQKELGRQIARPREWISQLENASLTCPPAPSDIGRLCKALGAHLQEERRLRELRDTVASHYEAQRKGRRRTRLGRPVTVEIIQGHDEVADAIVSVVESQDPEAILRNVGIKTKATYHSVTAAWWSCPVLVDT